jgi:hypothetical protein
MVDAPVPATDRAGNKKKGRAKGATPFIRNHVADDVTSVSPLVAFQAEANPFNLAAIA